MSINKLGAYALASIMILQMATPATTITWATSNSTIASVSNGRVTAKKIGTCIITARAHGKSVTCKVTVR